MTARPDRAHTPRSRPDAPDPHGVQAIRLKLKLTQGELAERLQTTLRTVSRWERGESQPSALARQVLEAMREAAEKK